MTEEERFLRRAADRIASARGGKRTNYTKIAKACGISAQTVGNFLNTEDGPGNPLASNVINMGLAVGLTPEELFKED